MATFTSSLKSRIIYVFGIADETHRGCLKIGETTLREDIDYIPAPGSDILNRAACERIEEYTRTCGVSFQLLYTEMTMFMSGGSFGSFNDKQIHEILERSGVERKSFGRVNAQEWFCCDLETVKKAIRAAKKGLRSLKSGDVTQGLSPIMFRPEQREAIDRTLKQFRKGNKMLWNAKMRFGKTLCALQVVREAKFRRTLILTHRPVVDNGWFEDYGKIFYDRQDHHYGSRTKGEPFARLEKLVANGDSYVYFASMQDLRGSEEVGGRFDKNNEVFSAQWDLIIIDEAHEGTKTELGSSVIDALTKPETKVLKLSGTPFNLLDDYNESEVFTWDYIMEQKAKREWDTQHIGEYNPYSGLPAIRIYTYGLGNLMGEYADDEKAFNFREFFRTDGNGKFVHGGDVDRFLDLLCSDSKNSLYPYSNDRFRRIFRHTLWVVPGVAAAKALSSRLQNHKVFGQFTVVNVAGDGDDDEESRDALQLVNRAIGKDPSETWTITLSCGRLTTGVSIKPWTAVFMMAGSFSTSASQYMQTIFRVQTPFTCNGRMKTECYVFDFAPDRTLRVLAEAARVSTRAGKQTAGDRKQLGEFLNFCPIISVEGSQMRHYDVERMMGELKRAQIERVVQDGFENGALYNDELLKLTDVDLKEFADLKKQIGATKAMPKTGDIDVNRQGFTDEEYDEKEKLEKKHKKELTEEEKKRLEELKKKGDQRRSAISILRGISIRMPLLIYGAELKDEDREITLDNFASLVDDVSWAEFMPRGVTKQTFKKFSRYYDPDVFREAGKRIREMARAADRFSIEERILRITTIFNTFRNPDKETVLTPWRVVNMHLSDCLGGYCFYDSEFRRQLEEPRLVIRGSVTDEAFDPAKQVMEINSKSGLYPLYCAYSIYRKRLVKVKAKPCGKDESILAKSLWDATIENNIFVVCKTPMAVSITRRTLVGFRDIKVNAVYYSGIVERISNTPDLVAGTLLNNKNFWNNDKKQMKFNLIVGNPPYQIIQSTEKSGLNTAFASAVYPAFIDLAMKLKPNYISMITPSRWMTKTGQGISEDWVDKMISGNHFMVIHDFFDALDCFPNVEIKGGVSYFLYSDKYTGKCKYQLTQNGKVSCYIDYLNANGAGIVIRDKIALQVLDKVRTIQGNYFGKNSFSSLVSPQHFFDKNGLLTTSWRGYSLSKDDEHPIKYYLNKQLVPCGYAWIRVQDIPKNLDTVPLHKIYLSKAYGAGDTFPHQIIGRAFYGEPNSVCSQTYLVIGYSSTDVKHDKIWCDNVISYMSTKFFRFMVFIKKKTQDNPSSVFQFVPLQDFSRSWSDADLYAKYGLTNEEIHFIESTIKPME